MATVVKRVSLVWIGYGQWSATIKYQGKDISGITTNARAHDRICLHYLKPEKAIVCGYTLNQAHQAIYTEIVLKHRRLIPAK